MPYPFSARIGRREIGESHYDGRASRGCRGGAPFGDGIGTLGLKPLQLSPRSSVLVKSKSIWTPDNPNPRLGAGVARILAPGRGLGLPGVRILLILTSR